MATGSRGAAPRWLGLAPAVFLLLWSGGFAFLKMGLAHAEPLTFLALRYAVVLAALLPLAAVLRPAWPSGAAAWRHLAVIGVLIQGLYFALSYLALDLGLTAGGLAILVSLQPIVVAVLAPRLAGERVGGRRWAGLVLGLTGAALVIGARSAVASTSALGVLSAVGALSAMTAGTLYEKRFGTNHHPVTANLVQCAVGLAVVLPAALALEEPRVDWTADLLVSLAYLVVGNSLVSITLLLAMIRHGEVSRVSALFFLVPPTAALIAYVVLGETLPAAAWLGMALAAGGVALANRP